MHKIELLYTHALTHYQTAALALGRLADASDQLAAAVVSADILPQLVYSLSDQNRFYKKAAAFVLRTVAKHSPELAKVGHEGDGDGVYVVVDMLLFLFTFPLHYHQ